MEETRDYFKQPGLSSSLIKGLIEKGEEKGMAMKRAFVVGGLVDLVITENGILEDLCVIDRGATKPRPQMQTFCESLMELYKPDLLASDTLPSIPKSYYQIAYEAAEIKAKKLDSVVQEFEGTCTRYWNYLVKAIQYEKQGIVVISEEEETQVLKCINEIRASRFLPYFTPKEGEVFNQLEIYTKDYKIKLDSLVKNGNVLQLIDLKTIHTFTENAKQNIMKFRYDIQAYYYSFVVQQILNGEPFTTNDEGFKRMIEENRASLSLSSSFNFVFVSKNYNSPVLEYRFEVEEYKNILDREFYTGADVKQGIEIYKTCTERGLTPSLTNYYSITDFSTTM